MAASAAGDTGSGNAGWDPLLLLLLLLLATAVVMVAAAAEEEARALEVASYLYSQGQSLSPITLSSWDTVLKERILSRRLEKLTYTVWSHPGGGG